MRSEAAFLLKGVLTYVPYLNRVRVRRARTGGTSDVRYCYSVWLRHLVRLREQGLRWPLGNVAELGPGDSIGTGLAALLSGAESYVALDVVSYARRTEWARILDEILSLFVRRAPVPDDREFPAVRPALRTYAYPEAHLSRAAVQPGRVQALREEIARLDSRLVRYVAPWTGAAQIERGSIDLLYSQAVLEHVDDLEGAYVATFDWLRPGGYVSHVIDFGSHHVSRIWNGHWRFPERLWRVAVGRREFMLNRKPLNHHLDCIRRAGFEVLLKEVEQRRNGLGRRSLPKPFRGYSEEDLRTSGAYLILRKP